MSQSHIQQTALPHALLTHRLLYYCQATINYLTFHWSCLQGPGTVELSSPSCCQLHRRVHQCSGRKNWNSTFVWLCLIRKLLQMHPYVSLGSSPHCRCGWFLSPVCPWHWQEASGIFFNVTHWCVQSCGDGPNPFWEVLTLNIKVWDCLISATPTFYYNSIDIDPETGSLQSFYFTILCECMCADLCECSVKTKWTRQTSPLKDNVIFHPYRLECDKWCDGHKVG